MINNLINLLVRSKINKISDLKWSFWFWIGRSIQNEATIMLCIEFCWKLILEPGKVENEFAIVWGENFVGFRGLILVNLCYELILSENSIRYIISASFSIELPIQNLEQIWIGHITYIILTNGTIKVEYKGAYRQKPHFLVHAVFI